MKKLLSLTLVAALVLSLFTGCSKETEKQASGNEGSEQVTVEIFQGKVEVVDQLDALVEDFEAANPNITVNIDTSGVGEDYLCNFENTDELRKPTCNFSNTWTDRARSVD